MAKLWRAALAFIVPVYAASALAASNALDCKTGPVTETYGGSPWLVYSCDDGQSVVVITAPGNPAAPFVFMVHGDAGKYDIHGEGTGDKKLTDAAFAEIKLLSRKDVEALIAQTRHH